MKVHALASYPHYRRHVEAVWRHLPAGLAGNIIEGHKVADRNLPMDDVMLVGGAYDIPRAKGRRCIYIEHGAGQSYPGDARARLHANYHGAEHPDNVVGYICPSKAVAMSWPRRWAQAVGCPALDGAWRRRRAPIDPRVIGITFHADFRLCPETRSARNHYLDHLTTMVAWLRNQEFNVVGHWHPRDTVGRDTWLNLGVPVVDLDEMYATASIVMADNTSVMYEAAALDIPIIAMNAPWYRRDVHHGLRFWDMVPGVQIDHWEDLLHLNLLDIVYDSWWKARRQEITEEVYEVDPKEGVAGPTAADFVCELLGWE